MNQFFLFKKITMIPRIFSDIKLNFTNIDKTCLEYSMENYGREIIFNFPLEMINHGEYVKSVYPYNINIGIVDSLTKLGEDHIDRLGAYDFIILYAESIDEVISSS